MVEKILSIASGYHVDLIFFTGDFSSQSKERFSPNEIALMIKKIIDGLNPKLGSFGVLGNHDKSDLVLPLEKSGLRMLINEVVDLKNKDDRIRIIGTDDPHYYYTKESKTALSKAGELFTIALVHTPELFDMALFLRS